MSVISYYDRKPIAHLDGTSIFQNADDQNAERRIASQLANRWKCLVNSFGQCAPIDWYAERHGRVVGLLELKRRTHPSQKYPTVFLNVRKWLSLMQASAGMRCPAIFVVEFHNGLFWVPLTQVDASAVRVAGCTRFVKSLSDREPVIDIPIKILRALDKPEIRG